MTKQKRKEKEFDAFFELSFFFFILPAGTFQRQGGSRNNRSVGLFRRVPKLCPS